MSIASAKPRDSHTAPWLLVTATQFKQGWVDFRGDVPVHRPFLVIRQRPDGYVVRNPELQILEEAV